jgi:hypothetical protein
MFYFNRLIEQLGNSLIDQPAEQPRDQTGDMFHFNQLFEQVNRYGSTLSYELDFEAS